MKFTCEREPILREIANASEIISARNSLSVLSNVLLEANNGALTIRATDLKVSYESSIPVDLQEPGSITVFCDKFHGILRSLPEGEIEFQKTDDIVLRINPVFKSINFQLKGIASDKYPQFQDAPTSTMFSFACQGFIDMISHTLFAVSDDETRYFMNGVFVEKNGDRLIMVATDGRRLAYSGKIIDPEVDDFKGVIVPPKVLSVVRRLVSREGELKLGVTDKNFHVEYDSQHLTSNLIDAQFPNYQRVIPDHQEHQIVIDRAALEEALRRVALLVEQKSRRIHLETTADNLTIRSSEGDIGAAREDVPCEFRGPEVVLAFNYVYLLDPLREMATDKVTLEFTDPGKALSLKPIPESDYHHVVMPMQAG